MSDAPPPEVLDALRRGFPLHMNAMGQLRFEGDPLSHAGVVAYFRAHLDVDDAGEVIIIVDGKWVYPKIADCPLRALRVTAREGESGLGSGAPMLVLDDGRVLPLDATTLREERGRGLRCTVPARASGRPLGVRFTNTAQMDLDAWLDWPEDSDSARPVVVVDEARTEIPLH